MRTIDKVLECLSEAPDDQIAESQTLIIKMLIGKSKAQIETGLTNVLNTCAYASFASAFAMRMIDEARELNRNDTEV